MNRTLDALLMDTPKNTFLANGHNAQGTRKDLPLYLPGKWGPADRRSDDGRGMGRGVPNVDRRAGVPDRWHVAGRLGRTAADPVRRTGSHRMNMPPLTSIVMPVT